MPVPVTCSCTYLLIFPFPCAPFFIRRPKPRVLGPTAVDKWETSPFLVIPFSFLGAKQMLSQKRERPLPAWEACRLHVSRYDVFVHGVMDLDGDMAVDLDMVNQTRNRVLGSRPELLVLGRKQSQGAQSDPWQSRCLSPFRYHGHHFQNSGTRKSRLPWRPVRSRRTEVQALLNADNLGEQLV